MIENTYASQEPTSTLNIPVDPEPTSFRLALLGILVAGFVAGYGISGAIFSLGTCNLLSVFVGMGLGTLLMQAAERWLKPRWKSNKSVEFSPMSIKVHDRGKITDLIDPGQELEVYLWRFDIPRRTRVPKGWYVVGLALEQNEVFFSIYTLISPDRFDTMKSANLFIRLQGKKEAGQLGGESNLRLAGQQRRLMKAETVRNMEGLEMLNDEFEKSVEWLQAYLPEWMPAPRL
jgi:hypothetical protein